MRQLVPVVVRSYIYNTPEDYIRRAIESILNQSFTDFVFQIIDNACSDGTKDIIEEYAAKDSRIRLLRNTWNNSLHPDIKEDRVYICGPKDGTGEYICSIDSDDWYEPDFIEKAYKAAKEHDADMVMGDYELVWEPDPSETVSRLTERGVFTKSGDIVKYWIDSFVSLRGIWNRLVRYDIWEEAMDAAVKETYINGWVGSDIYFVDEVIRRCNVLVSMGEVTYHYTDREKSSKSVFDKNKKYVQAFILSYKQHMDILSGFNLSMKLYYPAANAFKNRMFDLIFNEFIPFIDEFRDTQPKVVIEYLEDLFTDPMVSREFLEFKSHKNEFFIRLLYLSCYILSRNENKKRISNSFVAMLARVINDTHNLTFVDSNMLKHYFNAVYHHKNTCRAGRFLMQDVLQAYNAPFAELIPLLPDELLVNISFLKMIEERKSIEIFARLLEAAFEKNVRLLMRSIVLLLSANEDIKKFTDEFVRMYPLEASMIYHGQYKNSIKSFEERLDTALSAGEASEAEKILESVLRVAVIIDDANIFLKVRINLLELFVITEQYDKAQNEYNCIEEIVDENQLEEIKTATGFHKQK